LPGGTRPDAGSYACYDVASTVFRREVDESPFRLHHLLEGGLHPFVLGLAQRQVQRQLIAPPVTSEKCRRVAPDFDGIAPGSPGMAFVTVSSCRIEFHSSLLGAMVMFSGGANIE